MPGSADQDPNRIPPTANPLGNQYQFGSQPLNPEQVPGSSNTDGVFSFPRNGEREEGSTELSERLDSQRREAANEKVQEEVEEVEEFEDEEEFYPLPDLDPERPGVFDHELDDLLEQILIPEVDRVLENVNEFSMSALRQWAEVLRKRGFEEQAVRVYEKAVEHAVPDCEPCDKVHKQHGFERPDPYYELNDVKTEGSKGAEYLAEEQEYTQLVGGLYQSLHSRVFNEATARIPIEEDTYESQLGDYFYFDRQEATQEYPATYRRHKDSKAPELVLDLNDVAGEEGYLHFGVWDLSTDQQSVAYTVEFKGDERYSLHLKDLSTGETKKDILTDISAGIALSPDGKSVFYSRFDKTGRENRVYRHEIGTDPSEDQLLFQEDDERFSVHVHRSLTNRFIYLAAQSYTTSEILYLDLENPEKGFQPTLGREEGMYYDVADHKEDFIIRTNDEAKNYRIVKAPISDPAKENWEEIIPHTRRNYIEDFQVIDDHIVVQELLQGRERARLYRFSTDETWRLKLPERDEAYTFQLCGALDFNHHGGIAFDYESGAKTSRVYRYDLDSLEYTRLVKDSYNHYNEHLYEDRRLMAPAPSGGRDIPISLALPKDADGEIPILVIGYGQYADPMRANFGDYPYGFAFLRMALLERGWGIAVAHIPGGGEHGPSWHKAGVMQNKEKGVDSFIACLEHLVELELTSPELLCVFGRSAGGVLIGSTINKRPDLVQTAVIEDGVLDLINTQNDPTGPLVVGHYEEVGNPDSRRDFKAMMKVDPYENLEEQEYPNVWVKAGMEDPRVNIRESAKYVARLRDNQTGDGTIVLHSDGGPGHLGPSGRLDQIWYVSELTAFLLHTVKWENTYKPGPTFKEHLEQDLADPNDLEELEEEELEEGEDLEGDEIEGSEESSNGVAEASHPQKRDSFLGNLGVSGSNGVRKGTVEDGGSQDGNDLNGNAS